MTEWREVKLGDVADVIGGGTPKTSIKEYWDGNIPWLSVKDFNNDQRYVYKTEKTITEKGLEKSSTNILQNGDIIISARGTVGELAIIPFEMAFNQSCYGIRTKKVLDNEFLYYFLKNSINFLKKNTHGSVFDTITKDTLSSLVIYLPPLDVQKKIAGVLGALDDKIELNNKINQNLEAQAQALFTEIILRESEKRNIGMYCDVKSGFAFKSSWWQNHGVKVIKIKNIENTDLNLNECSYVSPDKIDLAKDFTVQGGDLLIAMTGATIGKFAIVPYSTETLLVNQRVGKFFLGNNPIERLPFIYCTLKQPEIYSEIINRGQGSAQSNISGNDIMSISCAFPDKKIIDSFNHLTQPFFQKIIMKQHENVHLAELRDTLLPKLMNGEIDVDNVKID